MKTKYLIIGNSAGGIGAAEAIRQVDKTGTITIVSEEPYPVYSRPLIAKYLAGQCQLEGMLFRPMDFYSQNTITSIFGKKVERLHLDSHSAYLNSGETITWEKLLLATGGKPIVPDIKNKDKEGVFTFTTLDSAKAIDRFLVRASRAIVIGGGLIGISVTEALTKRGLEVTIVEMKSTILNVILDEHASHIAEQALVRAGVRVLTGHTVSELTGNSKVKSAVLDSDQEIPCEMVIIAIGVTPRTELASGTQIKVNRGFLVDRHMATSHPDVFACGDAAEAWDFVFNANRLTPIWPNAYVGGRVAGFNMAGIATEYPGGTAMNSINYFGLAIASAGMIVPSDNECEVISSGSKGNYRKIILKDERVAGMVLVEDIEKSGMIYSLMRERVDVYEFKKALLDDDFGLIYLPPEVRKTNLAVGAPTAPPPIQETAEDIAGE